MCNMATPQQDSPTDCLLGTSAVVRRRLVLLEDLVHCKNGTVLLPRKHGNGNVAFEICVVFLLANTTQTLLQQRRKSCT
jgi:hypothetical protein